jgi:YlmC/YmxH family sporulation protein
LRASELDGKEVIDIQSGERYGVLKKSELLLDLSTGTVESLVIVKRGWTGRDVEVKTIPWRSIQKISDELILFEDRETTASGETDPRNI